MSSPYQQMEKLGTVPTNVTRCHICNGEGHVGIAVCINCEGNGGVLNEAAFQEFADLLTEEAFDE